MAAYAQLASALRRAFFVSLPLALCAIASAQVSQKWLYTDTTQSPRDERSTDYKVDSTGNSYLIGWNEVSGGTDQEAMITKLDSSGSVLWKKTINDNNTGTTDFLYSLAVSGPDVFVTGMLGNAVLTIKYDANGNELWRKTVAVPLSDFAEGYGVAADANGGA